MSNKLFENWENCNKELEEKIIAPHFGFTAKLLKKKSNNQVYIYMGFLPNDFMVIFNDFDEDKKVTIKRVYDTFNVWAMNELDMNGLLKLQGDKINKSVLDTFIPIANEHIKEYEKEKGVQLVTIFRACFGIGDITILPRKVQKDIYGEVIQ